MTKTGTSATSYSVIRGLEEENEALRRKLASHEFRQMERELTGEDPFRLDVHASTNQALAGIALPMTRDLALPRLPVPSGSIQADHLPPDLPVIGVYDDGLRGQRLAAAMLGLLRTQYRAPFARLVFLCSGFEAVPFLGRYGFVAEHIGSGKPIVMLPRLDRRYGVRQIRSIATGSVLAAVDRS